VLCRTSTCLAYQSRNEDNVGMARGDIRCHWRNESDLSAQKVPHRYCAQAHLPIATYIPKNSLATEYSSRQVTDERTNLVVETTFLIQEIKELGVSFASP
jgi:hypothetical protein